MSAPLRILTVIGARPQIIKSAALSRAVNGPFNGRIEESLLHTGQHYDGNMSQVFFDELGLPPAAMNLNIGSGSAGATTARMIEGIEAVLLRKEHDMLVIYGDTNSTLAGAIAASKVQVPVAHIEAGLRSFNKSMPEEVNRVMADHCSTWLFCPTETAVVNLEREGFKREAQGHPTADQPHVMNCGDVMYDNTLHFSSMHDGLDLFTRSGLEKEAYALVTVHRQQNADDPKRLATIFNGLIEAHRRHALPLVVPIHPRTRKMMDTFLDPLLLRTLDQAKGIHLIPPVGFLDMLALERHARLIITDSGGVQKEAFFMQKPCVILRAETEWVELVQHGQSTLVDADPERFQHALDRYLKDSAPECPPLFGDGRAAERICEQLLAHR